MKSEEDKLVVQVPLDPAQTKSAIVQPAVSTEEALKQFKAFQEIKEKCLTKDDKMPIAGKPYVRKTGWRKIKTVFNLTEQILSSRREERIDQYCWIYRVRVSAKNGVFADAEMSCDSMEDFAWADKAKTKKKPETMIMAMAQTRAFNRAIGDLVGGGELSAEEMMGIEKEVEKAVPPAEMKCNECGVQISQKVYDFSMQSSGKPLCYNHQSHGEDIKE